MHPCVLRFLTCILFAQMPFGSSPWIVHDIHGDLVVNKTVYKRKQNKAERKRWALRPVVVLDSCFECCPDVRYKTVCVVFTRR